MSKSRLYLSLGFVFSLFLLISWILPLPPYLYIWLNPIAIISQTIKIISLDSSPMNVLRIMWNVSGILLPIYLLMFGFKREKITKITHYLTNISVISYLIIVFYSFFYHFSQGTWEYIAYSGLSLSPLAGVVQIISVATLIFNYHITKEAHP